MPAELIDLETSLVVPPPPQEWLDKLTRAYEMARRLPKGPKTSRLEQCFLALVGALGRVDCGEVRYLLDAAGEVVRVVIPPKEMARPRCVSPAAPKQRQPYGEPRCVARMSRGKTVREED